MAWNRALEMGVFPRVGERRSDSRRTRWFVRRVCERRRNLEEWTEDQGLGDGERTLGTMRERRRRSESYMWKRATSNKIERERTKTMGRRRK